MSAFDEWWDALSMRFLDVPASERQRLKEASLSSWNAAIHYAAVEAAKAKEAIDLLKAGDR